MNVQDVEQFLQSKVDPDFKVVDNRGKEVPFTRLEQPVSASKVAIISSGGFHLKEEAAFDTDDPMGDASFRKIPRGATLADLGIAHSHYDHKYVQEDLNCVLPIEVLQELAEDGKVGQVAETHYSFMGYILRTQQLIQETVPQVAELLKAEGVQAVIITPT